MKLDEVLTTARDAITVRRVFADPYEKDGVTLIAGAVVSGGGGGGGGHDESGQEGEGGGFGMRARPTGAFVLKDGTVIWRPAVDVNRMILVAGAVAVAYLLSRIGRGSSQRSMLSPRQMAPLPQTAKRRMPKGRMSMRKLAARR